MALRVGIVGAGLIGERRADVVARDADSQLVMVADLNESRAHALAARYECGATASWRDLVSRSDIDAVIVSTFNAFLASIAVGAADAGKHVLCEKPLGRSATEAREVVQAVQRAGARLKVGFNLRFHPGIKAAHEICRGATLGRPLYVRAAYGHGGRPGYEREWRGNRELAGGGELLDQGVHIADLCRWFLGEFDRVSAVTTRGYWDIGDLEDNAFVLLWTADGAVANFHTSWTQWKNRFLFEIICTEGLVSVEGLGGSYGPERLVTATRRPEGGPPLEQVTIFDGAAEQSWREEWREFVDAIAEDREPMSGGADALRTMELIESIYAAASNGSVIQVEAPSLSMRVAAEVVVDA